MIVVSGGGSFRRRRRRSVLSTAVIRMPRRRGRRRDERSLAHGLDHGGGLPVLLRMLLLLLLLLFIVVFRFAAVGDRLEKGLVWILLGKIEEICFLVVASSDVTTCCQDFFLELRSGRCSKSFWRRKTVCVYYPSILLLRHSIQARYIQYSSSFLQSPR